MRIVAVSELTRYLREILEDDFQLQDLWVRGEITNYTQSSAGHRYFSLKDETASVKCVLFRGSAYNLPQMRNGVSVMVHGRMSIYEQRGDIQFYCDEVLEAGIGELHLRFEALKARLEAEGLFAEDRKRPLPQFPAVVGVVTSAQAAALRDIVRTIQLRCPLVRLLVAPVLVQGDGAAEQIADAVDVLNAHGEADVIIVARGGGSMEELWAFNEEVVARAIARSRIPVVSGVGHETDFTIADFVADLRASTPTAAAAAAVPDAREWRDALAGYSAALTDAIDNVLSAADHSLQHLLLRLEHATPERLIQESQQRTDELAQRLNVSLTYALTRKSDALQAAARHLHSLSPLLTLGRGYAIVHAEPQGTLVTSVRQITPGQGLTIRLEDGTIAAVAGPRLPESQPDVEPLAVLEGADRDMSGAVSLRRAEKHQHIVHLRGGEDGNG